MKLKFIADVHISPLTVGELRTVGHQINRVIEFLSPKASDEEIIGFARREDLVIITQDLDFSALIAQSGLARPSVVSLRIGNAKPQVVSEVLKTVLPLIEADLNNGAIVSVEETYFRVRKLPI